MSYWRSPFLNNNNNNNNNNESGKFSKFSSGSENNELITELLQIAYQSSTLSENNIEKKFVFFLKKELEDDSNQIYVLVDKLKAEPSNKIIDKWKNYYKRKPIFKIFYERLGNSDGT